jgi:hypothetical protein
MVVFFSLDVFCSEENQMGCLKELSVSRALSFIKTGLHELVKLLSRWVTGVVAG